MSQQPAGLSTRAKGRAGETAAESWLTARGYRIVERNHSNHAGEIDLIARRGEVLCFIEVKSRLSGRYGPAVAAVDRRKQRRLSRTAALYLAQSGTDGAVRFDVLGIDRAADGSRRFTLIEDAFPARL